MMRALFFLLFAWQNALFSQVETEYFMFNKYWVLKNEVDSINIVYFQSRKDTTLHSTYYFNALGKVKKIAFFDNSDLDSVVFTSERLNNNKVNRGEVFIESKIFYYKPINVKSGIYVLINKEIFYNTLSFPEKEVIWSGRDSTTAHYKYDDFGFFESKIITRNGLVIEGFLREKSYAYSRE